MNPFKKIGKKFRNIKLNSKLVLVYAMAGFLPVLILLLVTYFQMTRILRDKETETINSYIYQATASMDNEISIYNNLANYISYNQSISQVLGSKYDSIYEMYNQYTTVIDPILLSLMYFHNEIDRVTIYVDMGSVKHGSTLAPISEIENESWYEDTINNSGNHWYIDKKENKVFSVCKMPILDRYGLTGVLYISVNYDSVFEPFNQAIINNFGVFITDDENDDLIYRNMFFDSNNKKYELTLNGFKNVLNGNNKTYKIISNDSETTNWKIWLYKPDRLMVSTIRPIIIITVVAVCVCILAVILCIRLISEFITKRIHYLIKNMKEVEKGNFLEPINYDSEDEIGDLMKGYGNMVNKLNTLINEVYESRIKEKEYEMKALQAQINPHFLYNTLSLINWKAIEAGEDDISFITLSLSTFYRTSLNKGKNIMSVADEINNMKSYVNIQLMMHDNSFDVNEKIDEDILKYNTLNLILQPLIENAIEHGINLKSTGKGVITIHGYSDDDDIVLSVSDNGVGMTKEQAEKILTKDSKGYGVRNVNERIKLFYGEQYALKIESKINEGTTIYVRFPKEL